MVKYFGLYFEYKKVFWRKFSAAWGWRISNVVYNISFRETDNQDDRLFGCFVCLHTKYSCARTTNHKIMIAESILCQ